MLAGPMLGRFKKAFVPKPGGDKIGRRRLDTHIAGFKKLGAEFDFDSDESFFHLHTSHLKGASLLLDEPSVTGTANLIMASVLAEGTTTIYNAACEPYIQQLCRMLNNMGAKISGVASNLLTIEGVNNLHGTEHTMLPDMIEVGSFIGLAAMTQSDILIKNAGIQHLGVIPERFGQLGIKMNFSGDNIHIPEQEIYEVETFLDSSMLTMSDHPWPGLTPDLISIILVVATQAKGSLLIHQKMFESRLFFVDKIIEMGARIVLCDPHRAVVVGLERKYPLRGISMSSPDIRAGVALLIAALSAEGESKIQNIEQIDRGYQNIDERLRGLGAEIERM
jgi:UDP-N-acetylglucosamine 1-carboxyvinyltransferase